jgi:hypothetical protein
VGGGLADLVTGPAVQGERVAVVCVGVVVPAQPEVGAGEEAVHGGLRGGVGQLPGGGQSGTLNAGPVVPMPSPVEEVGEGPG